MVFLFIVRMDTIDPFAVSLAISVMFVFVVNIRCNDSQIVVE